MLGYLGRKGMRFVWSGEKVCLVPGWFLPFFTEWQRRQGSDFSLIVKEKKNNPQSTWYWMQYFRCIYSQIHIQIQGSTSEHVGLLQTCLHRSMANWSLDCALQASRAWAQAQGPQTLLGPIQCQNVPGTAAVTGLCHQLWPCSLLVLIRWVQFTSSTDLYAASQTMWLMFLCLLRWIQVIPPN